MSPADPIAADVIAANLARVRAEIAAAAERAGRPADDVRLVAVTKYARLEWVRLLPGLGVRTLGESRPQQLIERADALAGAGIEWHLVGHLQRNKVRRLLPVAACTHSVDSRRLLEAIDRVAGEEGLRPRVLLEVNLAGEATKDGFTPEGLRGDWDDLRRLERVDVAGLMTMPPLADEPELRRLFGGLGSLRDELRDRSHGDRPLPELSMGTSGDYPLAIECGATLIRVGRTLFDGLSP
jgi:PLP dependent protein